VEEELARAWLDHGGTLVADDRLPEPGVVEVRPDRAEHAARRDEHADTRVVRT
jgi:hypothetical protein